MASSSKQSDIEAFVTTRPTQVTMKRYCFKRARDQCDDHSVHSPRQRACVRACVRAVWPSSQLLTKTDVEYHFAAIGTILDSEWMYDRNDSSLKEIRLEFETMLPVVEAMRAQPHKVTSKNSGQIVLGYGINQMQGQWEEMNGSNA